MNIENKIIGFLGALSIGLGSVCASVSAAEFTYNLPDSYFTDGASNTEFSPYLNSLKNNPNLSEFDSEKLIVLIGRSGDDLTFFILDPDEQYNTSNSYEGLVFLGDYAEFTCSASLISSYNFTVNSFNPDLLELQNGVFYNTSSFGFDGFAVCSGQITDNTNFYTYSFGSRPAFYYTALFSSFESDYDEVLLPFFSLDVDDFYSWLVNNDKIAVSGGSGGVSVDGKLPAYIGVQKLKSFLQFYKSFGSSNQSFVKNIVKWFSFMNIAGQSKDNIVILKNTIDTLYNEYINYRSGTHAYWPGATKIQERNNIDTQTDNNNLTLVTDESNDTLDISILRDILRGVIAISNNLNQGVSDIVTALNRLDFTVNVANDGGNIPFIDFSSLYEYDSSSFNDDLSNFESSVEDMQSIPQGYIDSINQNSLMPEHMLEDKNSLTVNIPTITGFTVGNNGNAYSTQTGTYTLRSSEYPWLDTAVQKIKRFASILLIIGYLVHLRYRIPELVRGE